jgi:hypothetical protein
VDDALRAPAGLPWTTLRVAHRARLRPQAPQPSIIIDEKTLNLKIQGAPSGAMLGFSRG